MRGNPKPENRNPTVQPERALVAFQLAIAVSVSDFGLRPSFGLRCSGFGFHAPRFPFSHA